MLFCRPWTVFVPPPLLSFSQKTMNPSQAICRMREVIRRQHKALPAPGPPISAFSFQRFSFSLWPPHSALRTPSSAPVLRFQLSAFSVSAFPCGLRPSLPAPPRRSGRPPAAPAPAPAAGSSPPGSGSPGCGSRRRGQLCYDDSGLAHG